MIRGSGRRWWPSTAPTRAAPDGLYDTVQKARAAWQHAPEVPRALQQDLAMRYHDVLARLVAPLAGGVRWHATSIPTARASAWRSCWPAWSSCRRRKADRTRPAASPAELLAQRWRERLAANTMTGGQSKQVEETKWREAEQEVRSAQQQWMRLGPVPASVAGPLNERFQRACRKFYDDRRRAS